MLAEVFPLAGLRLRTPRLELRVPDDEGRAALAALAVQGIHPRGQIPFLHPFTEAEPDELARSVVQRQYRALGELTAEKWTLPLAVSCEGTVVGMQSLQATDFAVTREVGTGSWLGSSHQGRGIGTEMRAAVLHLAFAGLDAEVARSSTFEDTPTSMAVSRKLGYVEDGTSRHAVLGEVRTARRMLLTRETWERTGTVEVTVEGLEPCLPLLGAGSASSPAP
ncbi:acetyltransferase, ribosomal protein N-acetylase [Prauserella sp. Am3]|nr:acetyltransferase, ribosomal protein N-acetylase [Prauserella sp. Am3]